MSIGTKKFQKNINNLQKLFIKDRLPRKIFMTKKKGREPK